MTAPTEPLDAVTALRLLREVVAERPDHVYQNPEGEGAGCVYTHQGKPDCLVGHVLARAGFDIELIARLDGHGLIDDAVAETGLPVSGDAVTILDAAQDVQDTRRPWRDALAAAEAAAQRLGVPA